MNVFKGNKKKNVIFLLVISVFGFLSCTSTYKYDFDNPSDEKLETGKNIAVAVSEDGSYGKNIYAGSGRILSNVIKQELKPYCTKVAVLRNNETLDDFSDEELVKYDYIIIPEILHWEDRATAWSGLADKVEVSIEVYNSKKDLLKSATFSGKSANMTLSTNDPSELLEEPVREFFKGIFE